MKKNYTGMTCLSVFIFGSMALSAQTAQWARKIGGKGYDEGHVVAADASGNVYVAGQIEFTATFGGGSITRSSVGGHDVFVAKYNPSGTLLWATRAGGAEGDKVLGMAVSASGDVYVCGEMENVSTFGSTSLTSMAENDAFVARINGATGSFTWVKQLGGIYNEKAFALCLDPAGNPIITGYFAGQLYLPNGTKLYGYGNDDVFLLKMSTGGEVIWGKRAGGTKADRGKAVACDAAGNIYLAGRLGGNARFSPVELTGKGDYDGFLAKYDGSGNVKWVKTMAGVLEDETNSVSVDAAGNLYVTGNFEGTCYFGGKSLSSQGGIDLFLASYTNNGDIRWALREGTGGTDVGRCVRTVGDMLYLCGDYGGSGKLGTSTVSGKGGTDQLVAGYSTSGVFKFGKTYGGSGTDRGRSLALMSPGRIALAGEFNNTANFGGVSLTATLLTDVYVSVMNVPAARENTEKEITQASPVSNSERAFNLFPNPTEGTLNITLPELTPDAEAQLIVYDVAGREVYQQRLSNTQDTQMQIDMRTLPNGTYVVMLTQQSKRYFSRCVKY